MGLSFKEIKEVIKLINDTDINKFEMKYDDIEIKMSKEAEVKHIAVEAPAVPVVQAAAPQAQPVQAAEAPKSTPASVSEPASGQNDADIVKSPIVGTFYDSPSPDAEPFVKVGDKVKVGDVLCIVEAMKIMNEIKSQFDGEVAEIFLENEDIVEYNQPIMVIRR